jgi:FKBP-type peptidyl-prolyl cis-trans isomerase
MIPEKLKIMKNIIWINGLLLVIILGACVKDEFADDKAKEEELIKEYIDAHGITEADKLESGVYLKITSNSGSNVYPADNNYVIISYTGEYTDGTVFDSNIEDVAKAAGIYIDTLVYGPTKIKVGNTQITGFNQAIKGVPEGSSAVMVIPSELAQKNFTPVVLEVELHKVITSVDTFEAVQLYDFVNEVGLSDTLATGLYYKILSDDSIQEADSVAAGDSLVLNIIGQYAEIENYIDGVNQRTFFPLGSQPGTIKYQFGTAVFPVASGLETAIGHMREGDSLVVVMHSYYGYGTSGYRNDLLNVYIVQPFTPLYYRVKLEAIPTKEE